jgi:hypothetical protein
MEESEDILNATLSIDLKRYKERLAQGETFDKLLETMDFTIGNLRKDLVKCLKERLPI